jgi:hypothetical protein
MQERWIRIKDEKMLYTNKPSPEKWNAGGFIKNEILRVLTVEENEELKRELFLLRNEIEAYVNTFSSVDQEGNQYLSKEDYLLFLDSLHEQKI